MKKVLLMMMMVVCSWMGGFGQNLTNNIEFNIKDTLKLHEGKDSLLIYPDTMVVQYGGHRKMENGKTVKVPITFDTVFVKNKRTIKFGQTNNLTLAIYCYHYFSPNFSKTILLQKVNGKWEITDTVETEYTYKMKIVDINDDGNDDMTLSGTNEQGWASSDLTRVYLYNPKFKCLIHNKKLDKWMFEYDKTNKIVRVNGGIGTCSQTCDIYEVKGDTLWLKKEIELHLDYSICGEPGIIVYLGPDKIKTRTYFGDKKKVDEIYDEENR